MIVTWVSDVTPLLEEEKYMECYERLPIHRRERADRLAFQADKALSVGAWCLYEQMKKEYGLSDDAVFNLSHSGNFCLCSVDASSNEGCQLGCDIEAVKGEKLAVAERFFCEGEINYIKETQEEKTQIERFYRLWVLKESLMKATRLGMKLGMNEFEVGFSEEDKPYLKRQTKRLDRAYLFKEYVIPEIPYRIAVCSNREEFSDEVQVVEI